MSELRIIEQFPEQFQGGPYFLGISIDFGWKPIVLDACREIQERLTPDELRRFHWIQLKEKFGGLRMYWGPNNAIPVSIIGATGFHSLEIDSDDPPGFSKPTLLAIREIVARVCERAGHTCEICGAVGRLYPNGYWQTLCDGCAKKKGRA
jgi:hypothetical protein